MAWSVPDTHERVAEQMSRGVFRDGAWYRRQADGSLAEWPVLRLDRIAHEEIRTVRAYLNGARDAYSGHS